MSSGPRHFGKCKPPLVMAVRCKTPAQKRARIQKLHSMVQTNLAAMRHAQARIDTHNTEIAILEEALTAAPEESTRSF